MTSSIISQPRSNFKEVENMTAWSKNKITICRQRIEDFALHSISHLYFLHFSVNYFYMSRNPELSTQTSTICQVNLFVCYFTIFFNAAAQSFRNQHKGMMSRGLRLALCTVLKCSLLLKTQSDRSPFFFTVLYIPWLRTVIQQLSSQTTVKCFPFLPSTHSF